jgi:hypothetical protein
MSRLAVALVCAAAGSATAAPTETTTTPYPGVTHVRCTDTAAQQRAHFVVVDLSFGSLTVRATDEADRGKTASQIAALHARRSIKGDVFTRPATARRPGDGVVCGRRRDDDRGGVPLRQDRRRHRRADRGARVGGRAEICRSSSPARSAAGRSWSAPGRCRPASTAPTPTRSPASARRAPRWR